LSNTAANKAAIKKDRAASHLAWIMSRQHSPLAYALLVLSRLPLSGSPLST